MNALEAYFQGDYRDEVKELKEVQEYINDALETICKCQLDEKGQWPYCVCVDKEGAIKFDFPDGFSHSTCAMILDCLAYADSTFFAPYSIKSDKRFLSEELSSKLRPFKDDDKKDAKDEESAEKLWTDVKDKKKTTSGTYGDNDPLTLSWCYSVEHFFKKKDGDNEFLKQLIESSKESLRHFLKNECKLNFEEEKKEEKKKEKKDQNVHSFVYLKSYHLYALLLDKEKVGEFSDFKEKAFDFFEKRMHLHLSYYDIPDSRFDPAELVFSLEGALLSGNSSSLSDEAIERALQVIEDAQRNTPYWRPINPIYATKQGAILLPLSVEVANSILRICYKRQRDTKKDSPFTRHLGMFQRYFRWLKAHKIVLGNGAEKYLGWESEHVGTKKRIHTWQTSQIALFLMSYATLLQQHIAAKSLRVSGLKVEENSKDKYAFCMLMEQESLLELPDNSEYRIYDLIYDKFVCPRMAKGEVTFYSMLLYGPPGTGKTSVAECIAKSLGYKLITVTPSDFLAGGEADVEARAKAIFKCLEEQRDAVVLFDEIDHFLLDRDSDEYRRQTNIFQFMTPGMLPKFNDLRKKENCIFIVATNYAERIDPAIKRVGRIDMHLMLLPPACEQRRAILEGFCPKPDKEEKPKDIEDKKARIVELAVEEGLFTYGDMKSEKEKLVEFIVKGSSKPSLQSSIRLESYKQRFYEGENVKTDFSKTPIEE
jgi:hypothetical protein